MSSGDRLYHVAWMVAAIVFVLLCVNGYETRERNRDLIAECSPHGGVLRASWDGGTLVAVKCEDGERRLR